MAVSCIGLVMYFAVIVPFFKVESNNRVIAINVVASLSCYALSIVPSFWVIRQYCKEMGQRTRSKSIENRKSLEQIICTEDGFDLFANHLVKEFSTENLFFLFEMMQLKHNCITNMLLEEGNVGVTIKFNKHQLEKCKRQGSDVYNLSDLRREIKHIIEQYIYEGSERTINISAFTRMTILKRAEELKKEIVMVGHKDTLGMKMTKGSEDIKSDGELFRKYVFTFDNAMEEVISLLKTDSLTRFQHSKEYDVMMADEV